MKLFHLFALSALVLNFSGKPVAKQNESVVLVARDRTAREETPTMIPWTMNKRLVWEDFLCEPKRGTDAVASTSTSLGIAYQLTDGELKYRITCNFNKEKSWGLLKTDYILAHEQGHFDITEIFARKLNEALANYKFNKRTFKRDISQIYQSIVEQKESLQKMYDGETDHSRNRKMQYDWLEKIENLLTEAEPYADYP
jgi:predicted secreted Zn-dependent protease